MRWFNDTSDDENATDDFLAARIENVMQFEKFKAKAKEALVELPALRHLANRNQSSTLCHDRDSERRTWSVLDARGHAASSWRDSLQQLGDLHRVQRRALQQLIAGHEHG